MVDNGLGTTLLPRLAVDAGLLQGTNLVTRPLLSHDAVRKIGLVWRRGTGRRHEFRLLAQELMERAKVKSKPAAHLEQTPSRLLLLIRNAELTSISQLGSAFE